jgi:toxin ParE1/3/4
MLYKITSEADSDIIGVYMYGFQNFGETQAEKYFSELKDCFQFLSENPLVCRERTEFNPSVRIHHHGRHLVVYLIQDDRILIVRVLHQSMDILRHLSS